MQLLDLPAEIRETIYRIITEPSSNRRILEDNYIRYDYRPALALSSINRQIYIESRKVFLTENVFVKIETPFDEASRHVAADGHVPIIATGRAADTFALHAMTVAISCPNYQVHDQDRRFIIHLDDLPKFTATWQYSHLSYPQLNESLVLHLKLRDPTTRNDWQEPILAKALQLRLLMPFGAVKHLCDFGVSGSPQPLSSIVKELKARQAEPYPSPEQCLREAEKLKEQGNVKVKEARYEEALECYRQSWLAMHIVISGRQRHVHADAFYGATLEEREYQGQQGHAVRLVLRVNLVANTVLCYLKLGDYDVKDSPTRCYVDAKTVC